MIKYLLAIVIILLIATAVILFRKDKVQLNPTVKNQCACAINEDTIDGPSIKYVASYYDGSSLRYPCGRDVFSCGGGDCHVKYKPGTCVVLVGRELPSTPS